MKDFTHAFFFLLCHQNILFVSTEAVSVAYHKFIWYHCISTVYLVSQKIR